MTMLQIGTVNDIWEANLTEEVDRVENISQIKVSFLWQLAQGTIQLTLGQILH